MKLIALTACGVDYYPQNDLSMTGGNSLNVAAMWKVLDPESHVSVITCLGSDYHGSLIMDFFDSAGIDKSHVTTREGPSTCNQLWVEPNGERYGIGELPALRELAFSRDKLLVLTLGAEGSRAFYRGKEFQQAAIQVQKVRDTTGCGDAYQATFALSFLKTGDVISSMKSAAEAASKVVQIWGGPASLFKESSKE